jgi:hypothetical protein
MNDLTTPPNIATVRHFPDIERLFLEGCIGTDVSMLNPKVSKQPA